MEKFDRAITNELIEKVQDVLRSHFGDDTLEFAINGGTIRADKLKLNLEVRLKDASGSVKVSDATHTHADEMVKRSGVEFAGHIIGSTWLIKDMMYEVVDYISKRPKYPIQLRRSDGRLSKCTPSFLKSGSQVTKPTCTEFTTWCIVDPDSDAVRESDVVICDRVSDYLESKYSGDKLDTLCEYINEMLEVSPKRVKEISSYIYCELEGGIDRAIKYVKDAYTKEVDKTTEPKNVRKTKKTRA